MEQVNRIRYQTALLLAALLWLPAASGCAQPASVKALEQTDVRSGEERTAEPASVEIVSRNFSHSDYVDSIAFLLPAGWSCEAYEKVNAGEDMDPWEWGFEICMEEQEEPTLFLYAARQTGQDARFEPDGESARTVRTGAGLTGRRYTRQVLQKDAQTRQEYYVVFDRIDNSSAVYQIYASLTPEEYEKYQTALDSLAAGVSITAAKKE